MKSKLLVLLLACDLSGCQPALADKQSDAQFEAMDANGDGKLSRQEQTAGARRMFEAMDANRDGRVTASEMDAAQQTINGGRAPADGLSSQEKIQAVDPDGDGILSAEEHAAAAWMMFVIMDTNRDGFLSRAEFTAGHAKLLREAARQSRLRRA